MTKKNKENISSLNNNNFSPLTHPLDGILAVSRHRRCPSSPPQLHTVLLISLCVLFFFLDPKSFFCAVVEGGATWQMMMAQGDDLTRAKIREKKII